MRTSIKTKLSSLFLFLLIAAAIQGGMTIVRMKFVDHQLAELLDRAMPSLDAVETISALTVKVRLRQVRVALVGATRGLGVAQGVQRVHAPARKHVGAGKGPGGGGAARHQHLGAVGAVAQQQQGGRGAGGRRRAGRV